MKHRNPHQQHAFDRSAGPHGKTNKQRRANEMVEEPELDFTVPVQLPAMKLTVNDLKALAYAVEAADLGYEAVYEGDAGTTYESLNVGTGAYAVIANNAMGGSQEIARRFLDKGD